MTCPKCGKALMRLLRGATIASVQGSRVVHLERECRKCGYRHQGDKPETLLTEDEWMVWLGKRRPPAHLR